MKQTISVRGQSEQYPHGPNHRFFRFTGMITHIIARFCRFGTDLPENQGAVAQRSDCGESPVPI